MVGEALVDVIVRDGAETPHVGGSPLNVAVGLARLAVDTVFHSQFGGDGPGLSIAAHLAASGVSLTPATVTAGSTSIARALIGGDGAARYEFDIRWDPAAPDVPLEEFSVVHTGSIATAVQPGAASVERLIASSKARSVITFDPNIRPALMGDHAEAVSRVERFVALSDVVKASDEDLDWLYPGAELDDVLASWRALGPALVVATRGASGSSSVAGAEIVRLPSRKIEVVDTVGSGDSFMAGLIAALAARGLCDSPERLRSLGGDEQIEVVEFATTCAAITTSRAGANPPTLAELAD